MIKINKLAFSNVLSYGEGNLIEFDNTVTQLVGSNGVGKSSISTILEEALFNKNSKGIKKADLKNRYINADYYSIKIEFTDGDDEYVINKLVKSTTKVVLTKNGEDISGHTATQTYKLVESIIGMDFNTFSKLVNQSMVSSLDFLSATDAVRKQFLISLLGLEKYAEAAALVKDAAKDANDTVIKSQSSLETINRWLSKHSVIEPELPKVEVPEEDPALTEAVVSTRAKIESADIVRASVEAHKAKVANYQSLLTKEPPAPTNEFSVEDRTEAEKLLETAKAKVRELIPEKSSCEIELSKVRAIKENCHACGSKLDVGNKAEMLRVSQQKFDDVMVTFKQLEAEQTAAFNRLLEVQKSCTADEIYEDWVQRVKSAEVTEEVNYDIEDISDLRTRLSAAQAAVSQARSAIEAAKEANRKADTHNSMVAQNRQLAAEYSAELESVNSELTVVTQRLNKLNTLSSALGTKGLIAYKIESVVKVFESLINTYLQELSGGEFALAFSVEDTKLALNLYANSVEVDIRSLSSGELNKVNTATLLAVRKVMTSLSKVDINVMFLDEVVSVLDVPSRDTLIDVLLNERNLNTLIVSHGYTHPLASQIQIIKENKVSRLE